MTDPTKIVPNQQSSSQSWIQWHKAMKSRYGLKEANLLFVKAWDKRGGAGSKGSTNELREYMRDNDVKLDTTGLEDVLDTGSSVLDTIGGAFTAGRYISLAIGVIVLGGAAMLIFNIAKQPIKAAGAASNLMPMGKAAKLLK